MIENHAIARNPVHWTGPAERSVVIRERFGAGPASECRSVMRQTLDYSSQRGPGSNWPIGLYVAALIWAFVTLHVVGHMHETYREDSNARLRTQVPLLCLAAARLLWARLRGERSKGWIFYLVILVLAVPIWDWIAQPIASFARSRFGSPLIP
jgi:hypothetical protein